MYKIYIGKDNEKSYEIYDIPAKGIIELGSNLYQAINVKENSKEFLLFCDDLNKFFIFNISTITFTRILLMFSIPQKRSNYTLSPLSDGRIILFGGLNYENNQVFYDTYQILKFGYNELTHYFYSDIDIFGNLEDEAFLGHQAVVLENDHILIHGGTKELYDPLKDFIKFSLFEIKREIKIKVTNRFKILDCFNTYKWQEPLSNK
jgi:hypothetical protein